MGVAKKMVVYSKRKEFAPERYTFFQKGGKTILVELSPLKVYQFPLINVVSGEV